MELMNKDYNMAASVVDLGLQNRFWKGKNCLQSGRENFRAPLCAKCNSVILSLILCCTLMHYLTFSSFQNKSCYFNLLRRTLACPRGRPMERFKFARCSKILSHCEITSALAM